jgi:hypothetical protein
MTFTDFIERISEEYNITIYSRTDDFEIRDIAFLDHKHDTALKNILYFGYDKQLQSLTQCPSNCFLVKTEGTDTKLPNESNVAFVEESHLFAIFNDVKAIIGATGGNGIFEELTDLADKTHSIESVIDAASLRLGNSLLLCDMNFKIISSSVTIPVRDPLWTENARQGYCSYEFISGVKELKSLQNNSSNTTAIEVSCPQSAHRKLTCKVFHNQSQIGFLLMIEGENSILPPHFEMLSTISHIISYTIAYYTPDLFEGNSLYSELLYDMLIGAPSKEIMPRLSKLIFPSKMQVLFIRPTQYMGAQYLKNFTNRILKINIPGTHTTYHKNGIVAVIPLKDETGSELEVLETLKTICKDDPVRIGVSNSFSNIGNFTFHYEQAHTAFEMGQKIKAEELIYPYQDYQIFELFSEVKNPEKLGRYCHPALTTLRLYDHKNNSEFYKTLCVFIDKGCNIKYTSQSLFIHRNSLVYRLNRIVELCQLDFTDMNTVFLLRLSFLIDRYNELNTNMEWQ